MRRRGAAFVVLMALLANAPAVWGQEPQGPGPTVAATAENTFFPRALTVTPNTTVYWENRGLNHNVKFDDGLFEQPADPMPTPWRVWRHFDVPGTYRYYCEAHGGPGGQGMSGVVTVAANAAPVLSALKVAPRRVCDHRTRRCRQTTAVISFRLSEPATVSGAVDRAGAAQGDQGMEVSLLGKAGANKLRVPAKGLARGLYRVTLTAEDEDGNESDPATARFRVKRARR